jgi:hypothetical protein
MSIRHTELRNSIAKKIFERSASLEIASDPIAEIQDLDMEALANLSMDYAEMFIKAQEKREENES